MSGSVLGTTLNMSLSSEQRSKPRETMEINTEPKLTQELGICWESDVNQVVTDLTLFSEYQSFSLEILLLPKM